MPRVAFTPHLQRFLDAPPHQVAGTTVREALDAVFAGNPRLRGYILDERRARAQARLGLRRRRVAGGSHGAGATRVGDDTEIFVLQALSGG